VIGRPRACPLSLSVGTLTWDTKVVLPFLP
jgi:hypothetical protein